MWSMLNHVHTKQKLTMRFTKAPDLQYGAFVDGELVGFVCATRAHGETLTHESMVEHHPDGSSVCIHSVCVDKAHRRTGIASALLVHYLTKVWFAPIPHYSILTSTEMLIVFALPSSTVMLIVLVLYLYENSRGSCTTKSIPS